MHRRCAQVFVVSVLDNKLGRPAGICPPQSDPHWTPIQDVVVPFARTTDRFACSRDVLYGSQQTTLRATAVAVGRMRCTVGSNKCDGLW